jgi:hypothetical protein
VLTALAALEREERVARAGLVNQRLNTVDDVLRRRGRYPSWGVVVSLMVPLEFRVDSSLISTYFCFAKGPGNLEFD